MERLWSPWRSQHIERMTTDAPKTDGAEGRSLFARLEAEGADEANLILWRGRLVFVLLNRYPYNNGHLLIVPFREVAAYEALTEAEQIEIATTTARCLRWLRRALGAEGFNVGMNLGAAAGAGLPDHLHVHVVPRWHGDTNFMPTVGEVKVVPEALETTYAKLRAVLAEDDDA